MCFAHLGQSWRRPRSPCPCRRPSVVTEGYRRCLPRCRPTPGSPRVDQTTGNLRCFVCVCGVTKTLFFTVFRSLGGSHFLLLKVKKPWFFVVFGSAEGSRKEQLASWKSFNRDGLTYRQHSLNIGPKMGQHGANIGQRRANIGPRQGQHGPR